MENKSTEFLNAELSNCKFEDIKKFCEENKDQQNRKYSEWLYAIMEKKGMKSSDIEKSNAAISPAHFYKILNGTQKPSREYVLKIGLALKVTAEEMDEGLKRAGYKELYPKILSDSIIKAGILHGKSIYEINDSLIENGCDDIHLIDN